LITIPLLLESKLGNGWLLYFRCAGTPLALTKTGQILPPAVKAPRSTMILSRGGI
jgi:hypothetical protein